MELLNELSKSLQNCSKTIITFALERFAYMLAPFAPHLGEECWQMLGSEESIFNSAHIYEVDKDAFSC